MDSQVFGCPNCNQPFQVLAQQAGQIVQCPTCAQHVEIPADAFGETSQSMQRPDTEVPATRSGTLKPNRIVTCHQCRGQFGITDEMMGMQVACPHCQVVIDLKMPSEPFPKINLEPTETTSKQKRSFSDEKPAARKDELCATGHGQQPGKSPPTDDRSVPTKTTRAERQIPTVAPTRRQEKADADSTSDTIAKKPANDQLEPASTRSVPCSKAITTSAPPEKRVPPSSTRESTDPLLPPTFQAAKTNRDQQSVAEPPATAVTEPSEQTPEESQAIDNLLPPRFNVLDPARMKVSDNDDFRVFLPDGDGGAKPFDHRVLRVEHEGQKISLVALSPRQRMRRRLISNLIAILIGIAIMAIAFTVLTGD